MDLPAFLTKADDGEIRLTGHRIGLYHVVKHYSEGESAEMLACRYPTLPLSLVHKVLAYYLENAQEVDAYIETSSQAMSEQSGKALNFETLRSRLAAKQTASPETQVRS